MPLIEKPFKEGQRVRIAWAGDNSVLEGDLVALEFESSGDLAIRWGNQFVQFWDNKHYLMGHIFGLEDVTIEIVSEPEPV